MEPIRYLAVSVFCFFFRTVKGYRSLGNYKNTFYERWVGEKNNWSGFPNRKILKSIILFRLILSGKRHDCISQQDRWVCLK